MTPWQRDERTLAAWERARLEPPEDHETTADGQWLSCGRAGRRGCGQCVACEQWADEEFERIRQDGA